MGDSGPKPHIDIRIRSYIIEIESGEPCPRTIITTATQQGETIRIVPKFYGLPPCCLLYFIQPPSILPNSTRCPDIIPYCLSDSIRIL